MKYKIIYSDRRTLAITVRDAEVIVRSPRGVKKSVIETFVNNHVDWIKDKLKSQTQKHQQLDDLDEQEVEEIKMSAYLYFEERTRYFASIMNLKYSRIKITSAKRRFGSCNSKGNICFSYRLMLYSEAAREYVIVHELAHLKYMDHSANFYKLIERYMPDYKERKRLLK